MTEHLKGTAILAAILASAAITATSTAAAPKHTCVPPHLVGDTLAQARRALHHAHCRLGTVAGPRAGRITSQNPQPGIEMGGNRVAVVLTKPALHTPTTLVTNAGVETAGFPGTTNQGGFEGTLYASSDLSVPVDNGAPITFTVTDVTTRQVVATLTLPSGTSCSFDVTLGASTDSFYPAQPANGDGASAACQMPSFTEANSDQFAVTAVFKGSAQYEASASKPASF